MLLRLFVTGMQDGKCVEKISKSIKALDGISFVSIDFTKGYATVETYDTLNQHEITSAIEKAGYDVLGYHCLPG